MAKNWKVGEAVRAIRLGKVEDINDIGRRFPNFAVSCMTEEGLLKIIDSIPQYVSARKIEAVLKGEATDTEEEVNEEVEVEEPKKAKKVEPKKPAKKVVEEDEDEEEEEVKPVKKAKKEVEAPKKAKKPVVEEDEDEEEEVKPKKKAKKPVEDEDDDWDI